MTWLRREPRGPVSGWDWFVLGSLIFIALALMFSASAFGQPGDTRPNTQTIPIMGIDSSGRLILIGDFANHALRVNVVAGSGGGPSGTIGAAFPTTVAPAGARDAGGFLASFTVTNAGRLNVTCDNCSSSAATFAAAFPANGGAIGFKDGGGMLASATVDNAGNQFVIASQSSSSWTVFATGTITAHQGDTWTVSCTNCSGASTTNYAATFPAAGLAIGFKDGSGRFASAVVDNTGTLTVIASQGAANSAQPWFATGTISAHQADTWNIRDINGNIINGVTEAGYGATFPASGQPIGFKSASGFFASASVTNNNALFVESIVTDATDAVVKPGDVANRALRVNIVAGSAAGGTSSSFAAAFPAAGTAAGFRDGSGRMASAAVDNASNLFVIASQSSSAWTVTATGTVTAHQGDTWTVQSVQSTSPWVVSGTVTANVAPNSTIAGVYPSIVWANFKDGSGRVASAVVDNASNLFVIASQGTANAGQAWTVNVAQYGGTTVVNGGTAGLVGAGGPTATGSQASANPIRSGAVGRPTNKPTIADGNVADLIVTGSGDLYVRADTSAATGTLAPARVDMLGGIGKNGVATAVTVCDQFATVSMGWQAGNQQVITGPGAGQIHICSIMLIAASATSVSVFEGSGTLCNTNRTPIFGSTATVNGLNLATTGGFTMGSGMGDIAQGQYTGSNICIGNSTSAIVTGGIKWTSY